MIKIIIKKTKNNFKEIKVTGHANEKNNLNLVCAGVTAIITGGFNALYHSANHEKIKLKLKHGYAFINVIKYDDLNNHYLKVIYYQLLTIYEQNKNFIKLKEYSNEI